MIQYFIIDSILFLIQFYYWLLLSRRKPRATLSLRQSVAMLVSVTMLVTESHLCCGHSKHGLTGAVCLECLITACCLQVDQCHDPITSGQAWPCVTQTIPHANHPSIHPSLRSGGLALAKISCTGIVQFVLKNNKSLSLSLSLFFWIGAAPLSSKINSRLCFHCTCLRLHFLFPLSLLVSLGLLFWHWSLFTLARWVCMSAALRGANLR